LKDIGLYTPLRNTEQSESIEENLEKRKFQSKQKAKSKKKTKGASYHEESNSSSDDDEEHDVGGNVEDTVDDNGNIFIYIS
jgi:hypothetical protein